MSANSTPSFLSVVIPAYNEAGRIVATLDAWSRYLAERDPGGELLVVDDGSEDDTTGAVRSYSSQNPRVKLVTQQHAGKGAAVRRGMLLASGAWRMMADADLSMRPQEFDKLLPRDVEPGFDVAVACREGVRARRIAEPFYRHAIGRLYNYAVRAVVLGGISDTQCGYKVFSAHAAKTLFPLQRLTGFGFDVEILFLARQHAFTVVEVPITWYYDRDSRVSLMTGANAFLDIGRVRANAWLGRYETAAQLADGAIQGGR